MNPQIQPQENNEDFNLMQRQEGNDTLKSLENTSEMALLQREETNSKLDEINRTLELQLQQEADKPEIQKVQIAPPETDEEDLLDWAKSSFIQMLRGPRGKEGKAGQDSKPEEVAKVLKNDEEFVSKTKGEDGYSPIKGRDYDDGKDGYTPIKGVDYFDGKDSDPVEVASLIKKDSKFVKSLKGEKGDTPVVDTETIAKKVAKQIKLQPETTETIIEKIKDKFSFSDLKDIPMYLRKVASKTMSLLELDDVSISSPTNAQVLKYNSTTGKWENGTGGGGSGTVTDVSVVTANGISGTVANSTTTPAITLDISGLNATKIADGSVTNTEFQYLDGVSSNIQTQINAKGNALTTNPLSQFASTTSAQLAGVISDETGSGSLVFGTDPTFTTRINTPEVKATGAGGLSLVNSSGTQVALLGAGPGTGSSLTGTTNIGSASADYHQVAGGTGTITDTATGSSTNININLVPKGTGRLQENAVNVPTISSTDTLTNKTLTTPTINGAIITGDFQTDGLPDTDDTWTGKSTNSFNAAGTIAQFDCVYMTSSSTWALTDADAIGTAGNVLVMMAGAAGTASNPLRVIEPGSWVRNDAWNWTVGGVLYLDTTTSGGMTQTVPSGTDDAVKIVGHAVSADVIYFNPSPNWIIRV